MSSSPRPLSSDPGAIADAFVWARLAGQSLADFPGRIPRDLDAGYSVQDAAIARWPDRIAGWKVGWIAPERRDASGDDRLVGPIFAASVREAPRGIGTEVEFPVFDGGFAAIEAEYVFRLGADAPRTQTDWTPEDAAKLVGALHVGIETAGSPLATINVLGPTVVVSDFGNNAGLILGPAIPDWSTRRAPLACTAYVDGVRVGGAEVELATPLTALAFALGRLARRGRALRAGDLVTTGAVTGIHDVVAGQVAHVAFDGAGTIRCRAVPARARA